MFVFGSNGARALNHTGGTVPPIEAAKLPGGQTSVIILNKGAVTDLEIELDLGCGMDGVVETETSQAPALESRGAHITTSTKMG